MATEIILPEMGEGIIEGTIARWLKQEGERVELYEPVVEVETDKVTTETTAEVAGVLLKILVPEGQTVPIGTVLAVIEEKEVAANGRSTLPTPPLPYTGRISPVVGRIAEEHQVDLAQIEGTGLEGRITKQDILAYVARRDAQPTAVAQATTKPAPEPVSIAPEPVAALPPAPVPPTLPRSVPTAVASGDELIPFSNMRRLIAEHMVRSKQTSPHVTTVHEVDFTAVARHRTAHKENFARDGANLTFTAYIVAATVQALKEHRAVNSSWSDDGLVLRRNINLGLATAVAEGLIVPVIKQADSINLLGLARVINDLTERARLGKLQPAEVQGGTFTITNHGTSGSLFATPIINQPQSGILGIGKIEKRVKVIDEAIAIRPLAYVSFTFDHRILDGAAADAFVNSFKAQIEEWR